MNILLVVLSITSIPVAWYFFARYAKHTMKWSSIIVHGGGFLVGVTTFGLVAQLLLPINDSNKSSNTTTAPSPTTTAPSKGQTDNSGLSPLQIAMKEYNFKANEDILQLKNIIQNDGIEKAKATLYLNPPRAFPFYVISQKVDKYMIYSLRRRNDALASQLAVIPIPGEFLQKGASLPGEMYQFMGMISFTGLDGFERSVPLMQRLITESDKKGYGSIPDDTTSRNQLIGEWAQSTLWKGQSKLTFKQNGRVYTNFYSLVEEKNDKYDGKWSIKDGILSLELTAVRERNLSTNMNIPILKLTPDTVVLYFGNEETYKKIGN